MNIVYHLHLFFHTSLYPNTNREEENVAQDFIRMMQKTTQTINYFNTLRHQFISILLFRQLSYADGSHSSGDLIVTKKGSEVHLHILTIFQD